MMIHTYMGREVTYVEYDYKRDIYVLLDADENLVGELPRYEYLLQPQLQTIGNSNGKYRKSNSQVCSSPARQSGNPVPFGTFMVPVAFITAIAGDPTGGPIEDAGIRAGEVIGQRCWRNVLGVLHSVYMAGFEWLPNEPARGDVEIGHGIHAFKSGQDLAAYRHDYFLMGDSTNLVAGTVSMWGQIVEHEHGYRAEYAKILSLDTTDRSLRMRYGV